MVEYNKFKNQPQQLTLELEGIKEQLKQLQQELKSDQSIIDLNHKIQDYDIMIQCQVESIIQLAPQLGYSPEDYL